MCIVTYFPKRGTCMTLNKPCNSPFNKTISGSFIHVSQLLRLGLLRLHSVGARNECHSFFLKLIILSTILLNVVVLFIR